ncbi:MAG: carbohydrate ABC transporter substrate-binding protein [Ruminococcus sp.]|nr:carbohydrate ABC transporter substrate-binding protein [Ruminococcus sp.]
MAAAVCLVSCGDKAVVQSQKPKTEITLSWWGNDARTEYTIDAVEIFEELHPDIKVKCSYSEWSGYEARSRVQMISDTEADVMQINFSWLDEYSPDGNGYYDLSKVSDIVDLSAYSQQVLGFGTQNGVLNAVPIAMNAETVYINKTIYDRYGLDVPTTWDDIFTAAKAMRDDGIYPLAGASKALWLYSMTYAEQTTGKSFLDADSKIAYSPEELGIMIGFYSKLVEEKAVPQIEYFERINIDSGTYAGAVAWVSDAENYFGGTIQDGSNVVTLDQTAYSPDRSGEGWYAKPATLYAISKNTEHPQEAAMLLDFLLSNRDMAVLQGVEKGIPINEKALEALDEEGLLSGIQYEASLKMDSTVPLSVLDPVIEKSDLYDAFYDACNLVIYGRADLQEASQQLYQVYKDGGYIG